MVFIIMFSFFFVLSVVFVERQLKKNQFFSSRDRNFFKVYYYLTAEERLIKMERCMGGKSPAQK